MKRKKIFLIAFSLACFSGFISGCKKKELAGTEELRQLFTQTALDIRKILPLLEDNATPEKVRQGAENIEQVFKAQYATAHKLIAQFPHLLDDRSKYQVVLKKEMEDLRAALQSLIQRIEYWTPRMKRDKIFNATLDRISKLSTDIENQTRPAEKE